MINRISNKINRTIVDFLFTSKLDNLIMSKKKGAVILCYHGVDLHEDKRFNMRFFSQKTLERHFYYLRKHTNIISVKDYFEGNFDSNKLNVAITFDDGYRNNFNYLKPLIEEFKLPVSIYITGLNQTECPFLWADFADLVLYFTKRISFNLGNDEFVKNERGLFVNDVGTSLKLKIKEIGNWNYKEEFFQLFECEFNEVKKNKSLDDYWQIMSDDEIKACSESPYITIGSHSFYHNNHDVISLEDSKKELIKSQSYLENLTQTKITEIAYPDGAYTEELSKWAYEDLNFENQLALSFKFESDKTKEFLRSRQGLYPVDSIPNQLKNIEPILTL